MCIAGRERPITRWLCLVKRPKFKLSSVKRDDYRSLRQWITANLCAFLFFGDSSSLALTNSLEYLTMFADISVLCVCVCVSLETFQVCVCVPLFVFHIVFDFPAETCFFFFKLLNQNNTCRLVSQTKLALYTIITKSNTSCSHLAVGAQTNDEEEAIPLYRRRRRLRVRIY